MSKEFKVDPEKQMAAVMEQAKPIQEEVQANTEQIRMLNQRNSELQAELLKLQGKYDGYQELLGEPIPVEGKAKKEKTK